jgi:hypothetical protein
MLEACILFNMALNVDDKASLSLEKLSAESDCFKWSVYDTELWWSELDTWVYRLSDVDDE